MYARPRRVFSLKEIQGDRFPTGTMAELKYTKEGVPIFDGSPELYVTYKRAALVSAETIEWKKRNLVGPRLQAALEGSARLALEHMPPGWVSHEKGADQLLSYLKLQVRSPTLAEAGRTMSRFFYGIKRRRGEGMAAWIVRHDEALLEAKRTLAEAIHEYGPDKTRPSTNSSARGWNSRHSSRAPSETGGRIPRTTSSQRETTERSHTEAEDEEEDLPGEENAEANEHEEDEYDWYNGWWSNWDWRGSGWQGSAYQNSSHSTWEQKESLSRQTWDVSQAASDQAERFLPDFVIAWLLLQWSGLDATEKSVIVANLKNQFRTDRVKESLKLTWPDEELRKRDGSRGSAMFSVEEAAMLAEDDDGLEEEYVTWEDPADDFAYQALEAEAQEAYAAAADARRTLRDAREKQAMMRRNRNFFTGKGGGKGASSKGTPGQGRPPVKCFKCGGPHLRKDCPEQGNPKQNEQAANLVFSVYEIATEGQAAADEPTWQDGTRWQPRPPTT